MTLKEHLTELKTRSLYVIIIFFISLAVSYVCKEQIYQFILTPLVEVTSNDSSKKMIYTGLAEAFFTYIKLSAYSAFVMSSPVLAYNLYKYLAPGLYQRERRIAGIILACAPLLFLLGGALVYYYIIPKAWEFFISFETSQALPLQLEAKISEYVSITLQLITAFGIAFQMPIMLVLFSMLGILHSNSLKKQRRFAIVIMFIIGGVLTPPDILSQIGLAIPLILLYELSIMLCKFVEKGDKTDVRYQVD